MKRVHGTHKASKSASEEEDITSRMPENVMTNILNRLPLKDAVRTGILSRNWKFKWNMLTQLVFNEKFLQEDLPVKSNQNERNISRILFQLKGSITKFVLRVPYDKKLNVEEVSLWVMFLSRRGIEEFTVINQHKTPLKLPAHLFSCLELKHLILFNCSFHLAPSFRGLPNLSSLRLQKIIIESGNCGEFISRCPLLVDLYISFHDSTGKIKPVEIAKLENLESLSFPLCKIDNISITSSRIFQLLGFLPKLQDLSLDFRKCEFSAETGARISRKIGPTVFPCLKTLTFSIDFSNGFMLPFAFNIIRGSPNLQSLGITDSSNLDVPPPRLCSSEVDYNTMGQLQLRSVVFGSFRGSENEICLIKSLLACCPWLKMMLIQTNYSLESDEKMMFARKLLKLHRASPLAEVIFG